MHDIDRARSALAALDSGCPRAEWVSLGMAAKAAGLSFEDFHGWSEPAHNYRSEADCRAVWRSISETGGTNAGSLFFRARMQGWQSPPPGERHDPNGHARPRQTAQEPRKPTAEGKASSFDFAAVWRDSEPAQHDHSYIANKLGLPDGLRVYRGPLRLAGQALDGALLVPACGADGNLQSWQAIAPEGDKRSAPGASMRGASHTVGGEPRAGEPIYVVEGIGQAWSAHQATGKPAVVCFGAGNVETIAVQMHERHPTARIVIVADAGKESDAERIARAVGGGWVAMPAGSAANFDLNDYHLQVRSLPAVAELLAQVREPEPEPEPRPQYASLADLDTDPPPPRRWIIDQWLPRGTVTALFGGGGIGKSLLVQQIATCVANGIGTLGATVTRGPVLAYLCEDDNGEVRRRQRDILAHLGRSPEYSAEGLHIAGRAGCDNVMMTFGADRLPVPGPFLAEIEREVERIRPAVLILDNIAQLFAGLENDRYMVTAFANLLAGIAHRHDCAVLLLGHVAKVLGSEYSGSTAWEAAVRTRLWMERREDGLIALHRRKANYAGQASVVMEYQHGALMEIDESRRDESAAARAAEPAVLDALATLTGRQVATSHAPAARNNLILLATKAGLLKTPTPIAMQALAALIDAGRIVPNAELPWRKADRHRAIGLSLAPESEAEHA